VSTSQIMVSMHARWFNIIQCSRPMWHIEKWISWLLAFGISAHDAKILSLALWWFFTRSDVGLIIVQWSYCRQVWLSVMLLFSMNVQPKLLVSLLALYSSHLFLVVQTHLFSSIVSTPYQLFAPSLLGTTGVSWKLSVQTWEFGVVYRCLCFEAGLVEFVCSVTCAILLYNSVCTS